VPNPKTNIHGHETDKKQQVSHKSRSKALTR